MTIVEDKPAKEVTMILVFDISVTDLADAWAEIEATIQTYTESPITKNVVEVHDI